AGLMMSVCGTRGAGVLAPAVIKLMSARFRVPGWAEVLAVGSCASAATLPLSMLIFGRFSTVSPLTSVIAAPLFFFIMICSLAAAFSGGLLAEAVLLPAGLSAKAMIAVMRFFSAAEYACIGIDADTAVPFTVITVIFALVTFYIISKVRAGWRPAVISTLLALCVLTGILTFRKLADSDITTISVFSDGSDYFAAVRDDCGVSAFSSSVNSKLSSAAYDALTDARSRGFTLLCVLSDDRKHGAVHSDTFEEISAAVKYHPENDSRMFDISGKYTAQVYEEGILLDINGVRVVMADVAAAPVFGPCDVAIYSGYKKNERYGINGITVLCDKRYTDITDAFSAYYYKTEICIDSAGKVLIKTE
ncbi:MAG: ComEC/Rec2 family competence protein, partial [Ruminiclostridium sp.]|nr:ComEC/Rec2 family competence protein [Ruminiclostridium sp.]